MGLMIIGLAANAGAAPSPLPANPYKSIAARNIFDLTSSVALETHVSAVLPPKITPNGIMSIFGQLQVLFKVSGTGKPGAKETFYLLNEGQMQDDIEVRHIDLSAGQVTFSNHGVVQKFFLPNAEMTNASIFSPEQQAVVFNRHPASFELSRTPDYLGGGDNASFDPGSFQNLTQDERIALIEAQRAYYKSRNDSRADLLPATALTPPEQLPEKTDL